MLVLTRKSQERILIGDNITVTILRVKGTAVRIGIDAPADVRVVRGELSVRSASSDACEVTPAGVQASRLTPAVHEGDEAGEEPCEPSVLHRRPPLAGFLAAAAHAV